MICCEEIWASRTPTSVRSTVSSAVEASVEAGAFDDAPPFPAAGALLLPPQAASTKVNDVSTIADLNQFPDFFIGIPSTFLFVVVLRLAGSLAADRLGRSITSRWHL